jgi:hypothetical protein
MKSFKFTGLLVVIFFSLINLAYAAEITIIDGRYKGEKYVSISGPIEKGDYEKVRISSIDAINMSEDRLTFHLNTSGGDLVEAMKIGRFARKHLARIYVYGRVIFSPGDKFFKTTQMHQHTRFSSRVLAKETPLAETNLVRCYSAGVIILFGGVSHWVSDNGDFRTGERKIIPVIGIHRPYFDSKYFATLSPEEAKNKYGILEQGVRDYLKEMGAPQSLADRMFRKASDQVELIPDEEFREMLSATAPFIDEWIIAKCGSTGPRHALSKKEHEEYQSYTASRKVAASKGLLNSVDDFENFVPTGSSLQRIKKILNKIDNYNNTVMRCEKSAIRKTQTEWMSKQQMASSNIENAEHKRTILEELEKLKELKKLHPKNTKPTEEKKTLRAQAYDAAKQHSYSNAVMLYKKSIKEFWGYDGFSMFNLGLLYAKGRGAPQNFIQAYKWLSLSAFAMEGVIIPDKGYFSDIAEKERDKIADQMTPAQIAEAQKLSSEWMEQRKLSDRQKAEKEVKSDD